MDPLTMKTLRRMRVLSAVFFVLMVYTSVRELEAGSYWWALCDILIACINAKGFMRGTKQIAERS